MNLCWHLWGRPRLHLIWNRDHAYVTVTAFGRRWHWDTLPPYTHPE